MLYISLSLYQYSVPVPDATSAIIGPAWVQLAALSNLMPVPVVSTRGTVQQVVRYRQTYLRLLPR